MRRIFVSWTKTVSTPLVNPGHPSLWLVAGVLFSTARRIRRRWRIDCAVHGLTARVDTMGSSVEGFRAEVGDSLAQVRAELGAVKSELVPKKEFESLVERVGRLELKSESAREEEKKREPSREIARMKFQLDQLDPARRQIACRGFKEQDVARRVSKLQNAVSNLGIFPKMANPTNIYSGKRRDRKLTDLCLKKFSSTADRDSALEKVKNLDLKDAAGGKLSFRPALTFD